MTNNQALIAAFIEANGVTICPPPHARGNEASYQTKQIVKEKRAAFRAEALSQDQFDNMRGGSDAPSTPKPRGTVREAGNLPVDRFSKVSEALKETGDTNDCAVKAIAIATGADPIDVQARLATLGREKGKGTLLSDVKTVMSDLGYSMTAFSPKKVIAEYPGVHSNLQNVTTGHATRFPEAWAKLFADKTLLIFSTEHFSCFIDGKHEDWSRNRSKRVQAIYIVKKVGKARKTVAPKTDAK